MDKMPDAIGSLDDASRARVVLFQSGRWVHIALAGLGLQKQRTITGPAEGITVTNGDGVAGDPTLALANDLAGLEGLAANGLAARTATDTWAVRTITAPAAGITVTNGDGVAGNPTLALADDLAALEGLSTGGFATRVNTNSWSTRTITGTSNEITVTSGNGASGNPTISLPTSLTFTGKTITGGTFLDGFIRAFEGAAALPGISFNDDTDTGMYLKGTNNLGFATAGLLRGEITSTGRMVWSAGDTNTTLSVTATSSDGNAHGARINNSSSGGGSALLGVPAASGGYAGFGEAGTFSPFTGSHPGLLRKDDAAELGDILVDVKVLGRKGIDDTVTEVARSSGEKQRSVIGVLSLRVPFDPNGLLNPFAQSPHDKEPSFLRRKLAERFDLGVVNSVGEGQMNVCGLGGDLEPGDLICTSDMPGKGMRQNDGDEADDLIRRCTVARVRERVTFDNPSDVKLVACIYLAG